MIDFRIKINDEWEALDTFGDCPAMNFQTNTLSEFKERNADYSQAVNLPRSPRNERLLGFNLRVDSESRLPYRYLQCAVFSDGVRVTPPGAVIQITSLANDSIGVQVLGADADLAETLQNRAMASEEADGFWLEWTAKNISEANFAAGGAVRLRWCAATMATDPRNTLNPAMDPASFIDSPVRAYPFLNFYDLVKWILAAEGWALETSGVSDKTWGDEDPITNCMYVGCVCLKEDSLISAGYATAAASFYGYIDNAMGRSDLTAQWSGVQSNPSDFFNAQANGFVGTFYAMSDGILSVQVQGHAEVPATGGGNYQVVLNIGGHSINFRAGEPVQEQIDIDVQAGDYVSVSIGMESQFENTDQWVSLNFDLQASLPLDTATLDVPLSGEPISGGKYDLLACLGFDNRLDFVKEFMGLLGLTLRVDYSASTAYMYTMGSVYDRCSEGEGCDWTGLLEGGGKERALTFAPDGYARENTLKFAEDEAGFYTDSETVTIDNDGLEKTKDLFESKFLSVRHYLGSPTVNIPLYSVDDEGEVSFDGNDKPILAGIDTEAATLETTLTDTDGAGYEVELYYLSPIYMKWFISNMYGVWFDMVREWKALEAYFNFRPQDIEELDLTRPVWLGQFGHWFYIQKINNYQLGKLTKINLLKIK